jgi:hypothetical protein
MFMSLNVMEGEHRPITGRQLSNSLVQRYPVNYRHGIGVFRAFYYLNWRFPVLSRLFHPHPAFAEMHQHLIDCQPVQPGSKGGFAPEATDFSKELNEDLLCEVFSLRNVPCHPQAERVDAPIMPLVKVFESSHVALGRLLRQLIICRLRCLGFGCGHVARQLGQARKKFHKTSGACLARSHASASFKGAALFLLNARVGMRCEGSVPSTRL